MSWFESDLTEDSFKTVLEKLQDKEISSPFYNIYIDELKVEVSRYRDMLNRFECLKVDIYIKNIFTQRLD